MIDGLQLRAVHVPKTMLRREYYRKLKEAGGTVTAQKVYRELCLEHPQTMRFEQLVREFRVDDHSHWEEESQKNPNMPQPQKQRWDDIRDRMQTEIETFSKEAASAAL